MTGPCSCWSGPVTLHSSHCCFREEPVRGADGVVRVTCEHDADGRALLERVSA